uniref:Uncharacterized protein n=1 Tax=Oryza nivara TaxID=4536 RepID=A0A0E0IQ33_ORYNI
MCLPSCRHSLDVYKKDVRANAGAAVHLFPAVHLSTPLSLHTIINCCSCRTCTLNRYPPQSSMPITSQWQGEFVLYAQGTRMVHPMPQMPRPMSQVVPPKALDLGGSPMHPPTNGTNPWQGQYMDYAGTLTTVIVNHYILAALFYDT